MASPLTIAVVIKGEDDLSRPVSNASRSLAAFNKTAQATESTAKESTSAIGRMAASFGKFAAVGAGLGAVTVGMAALGKVTGGLGDALIGSNKTMENTRARLVAMTKSGAAADKVLAQIREEADKTPFAFEEMAKATASLMPAAKQSGVALMDLVKQAEILAASNPEQGLEGAAFALREALSGDFASVIERFDLPRQRLNELKAQGVPAVKAISIAMKEMGLDAELVARQAETLDGRWSTFQDTIAGFGRVVGGPLFDQLKRALEAAQGFLEANKATIEGWATAAGDAIGRVATTVVDLFTGKTSPAQLLADGLAKGKSIAGDLTAWLGKQWAAIDWGAVWKQVTGMATGLLTGLGDLAKPVTAWVSAQWAAIDWAAVWKSVKGHGEALAANLAPVKADLEKWLTVQWGTVSMEDVLRQAHAEQEMKKSWAKALDEADTQTAATAVAGWLKRGFTAGVNLMTGQPQTFDQATALTMKAWGESLDRGDWGLYVTGARVGFKFVNQLGLAIVEAPNWDTARLMLQAKVEQMVTGIFPLRIGPLTIGLTGATLDLSGIGAGTRSVGAGGQVTPGAPREGPTGPIGAYQHGGSFTVGGSGGPDSQMVAFRATPGERVTVSTPAQQAAGGVNVVLNIGEVRDRRDADHLAAILPDALTRALEQARSQQGLPQVSGLFRYA